MAVDVWPSTLPQRLIAQSYNHGLGDGRLRSQTDTGPAKMRRRSSAMPRPLSGVVRMNAAQVQQAAAFVDSTLIGGSLPFNFPEPFTRQPVLVRFVDMPSWTCVGGDNYDFTMSLEIMP